MQAFVHIVTVLYGEAAAASGDFDRSFLLSFTLFFSVQTHALAFAPTECVDVYVHVKKHTKNVTYKHYTPMLM